MRLNHRKSRWQHFAPALVVGLGTLLAACGGGGDVDLIPTPAPASAYTSGRPAASTTAITTAAQLSHVIGIEGAARVTGDIPAPTAPGLASLNHSKNIIRRAAAAGRKIATVTPRPRIANDATNYAAIQGSWLLSSDATGGSGYIVSGDAVTAAAQSGGTCASSTTFMDTATFLSTVTSLSANAAVLGGTTNLTRDTGDVLAACDSSTLVDVSAWYGTIVSNVGQVLFTDNSTFNYSFSSATVPTAVFVKITGADDYFIVPATALRSSLGTYTIQFYGPTTSGTQIITGVMSAEITVQAFYGPATPADLADGTFNGSDVTTNWSAPIYVPVATQAVATGALQFNLTWNTLNDVDLHVIEPDSNEIFWASPVSESTGQLDVDNTYGYGPENIYWQTIVPNGTYQVFVENYDGDAAPAYTLTVTKLGHSTTYNGTLPATAGAQSAHITVTMP